MSDNPVEQVISDLFQYLESLETKSASVLQFLKDKGLATDEEFSRYLEQAGEASNVKWRAARVRMEHLFATIPEPAKQPEANKEKAL